MPEPLYSVEFDEVKGLQEALRALERTGGSLRRPIRKFLRYQLKQTDQTFVKRGRGEVRWPPLAPSTVRQKRRLGMRATSILQGPKRVLRKSMKQELRTTGLRHVASLFTDVFYGAFHQSGTRKMPQRQILFFTPDDITKAEELMLEEVEKSMRDSFARGRR